MIVWATNQTFSNTQDGDIVQQIIPGDLVIKSGVTVTTQYRCKGLHIQVMGNCYLYGTIDMTGKGANAAGANVGLEFYNDRNTITLNGANYSSLPTVRKIPSAGASGASGKACCTSNKVYISVDGGDGYAGTNGQCGGGGSGSVYNGVMLTDYNCVYSAAGAAGTSFSGGAGSGGSDATLGAAGATYGTGGSSNGGAGGNGGGPTDLGVAGGGAGNAGGTGWRGGANGTSGTGGLIVLSVLGYLYIASGAYIKANGSDGGSGTNCCDGGGSGGGSVNILYGTYTNSGTLQANGGRSAGSNAGQTGTTRYGGRGGAGSIRYNSFRTT
jgi:hypothetical protein